MPKPLGSPESHSRLWKSFVFIKSSSTAELKLIALITMSRFFRGIVFCDKNTVNIHNYEPILLYKFPKIKIFCIF